MGTVLPVCPLDPHLSWYTIGSRIARIVSFYVACLVATVLKLGADADLKDRPTAFRIHDLLSDLRFFHEEEDWI